MAQKSNSAAEQPEEPMANEINSLQTAQIRAQELADNAFNGNKLEEFKPQILQVKQEDDIIHVEGQLLGKEILHEMKNAEQADTPLHVRIIHDPNRGDVIVFSDFYKKFGEFVLRIV
ncbi:MAG: hypothetical protein JSR46_10660, partial [Verrucomicrobia bacterium]|nr:hypothetical protein [Verrucomicrobiota bacterium]